MKKQLPEEKSPDGQSPRRNRSARAAKRALSLCLAATIFSGALAALTSCIQYEDVVPDPAEYAEWDGNYLYAGNYRSKTTGEDCEPLVTEIEADGRVCSVVDCAESEFYDGKVYLCLRVNPKSPSADSETGRDEANKDSASGGEETTAEKTSETNEESVGGEGAEIDSQSGQTEKSVFCLVVYDPADGSAQTVCTERDGLVFSEIFAVHSRSVVLQNDDEAVEVDMQGNVLDADCSRYLRESVNAHVGEYSFYYDNQGVLYCRDWRESADAEIARVGEPIGGLMRGASVGAKEFSHDGREGFLIECTFDRQPDGEVLSASEWGFYDKETKTYTLLREASEVKYENGEKYAGGEKYVDCGDGYFIIGREKTFSYMEKQSFFGDAYRLTTTLTQNCRLYRLDFSATPHLTELYVFPADRDYDNVRAAEDGKIYIVGRWIKEATGCGTSGLKSEYCVLTVADDGKSADKKELSQRKFDSAVGKIETESAADGYTVTCGRYTYYIEEQTYGGIWLSSLAYYLNRRDSETGETALMQFWTNESGDDGFSDRPGERYAADVWGVFDRSLWGMENCEGWTVFDR